MSTRKLVGGQAVIEGVMMKHGNRVATVVRKEKTGELVIKEEHFNSWTEKFKILKLPILRGIVFLFEMLIFGIKTLTWSANQQDEEEEQLKGWQIALTLAFSFSLVILIFVVAPYYLTRLVSKTHDLMFNLMDGVLRFVIFIAYILLIGLMKDVKRVFQYHGAEHKAVNCHEAGEDLTIKNVMKHTTKNIRCGTSLIVFVIAVSIILFSMIRTELWYINLSARIVFMPLIGGIAYEVLKLSHKYEHNIILRTIAAPGLWVQSLTTKEPDEKQVECAISAIKKVL